MSKNKRDAPEDPIPKGACCEIQTPTRGLGGIQGYRKLRRENPSLENYEVWALAGYGPAERALDAANAPWADGRAAPAPAKWRGPWPQSY